MLKVGALAIFHFVLAVLHYLLIGLCGLLICYVALFIVFVVVFCLRRKRAEMISIHSDVSTLSASKTWESGNDQYGTFRTCNEPCNYMEASVTPYVA